MRAFLICLLAVSALAAEIENDPKPHGKKPVKRGSIDAYSNSYPGFEGYSELPNFSQYSGQFDSNVNTYSYEGGIPSSNVYPGVETLPQHTETFVNHPAQTVVNQVDNVVKVPYTVPKAVSVPKPVPFVVNNPVPVHVPKVVPVQVGEEHHISQTPLHVPHQVYGAPVAPVRVPHQVYGAPVTQVHHPVKQVSITEQHTLPAIRTFPAPQPAPLPLYRAALPTFQAPLPAAIPTFTAPLPAIRSDVHHVTTQNLPAYVEEHHHHVPVPVAPGVVHHSPVQHYPVYQQQTGVIAHEEFSPVDIQRAILAIRANLRLTENLPSYASGYIEEHHHQLPVQTETVQHIPVHHQETVVHTPVHHEETIVHHPVVQQQEILHQPIVHHPAPVYQQTTVVNEEIAPETPAVVEDKVKVATAAPVVKNEDNKGYDYPKPARRFP